LKTLATPEVVRHAPLTERADMSRLVEVILVVFLLLLLIGMLPVWPYSGSWGYYPSGGFGLLLLILIIAVLFGARGDASPRT
jgi:asparagine N-glycosylation enzyme membrane subunit Stt3